ncbi:MAG: 50S ribosomal protein L25/general stress protein Ctc [SAR86 cluster bacterium]|uniref:Large ribosomal subunit protein bL25 n=1 Tax=SAR86 cluster bacterium TaxID=2030880 RepID=A0A2A5CGK6_9GAMM|nr:50S ribosomal protein L25/general stress protein Ctc [Gammaproteobacteria bacterium AH-315-E17]PCJ42631.1 MAG: 50S ribosomal protein L25/general stress protein Ctc [SAR86 cluster bacterium]
MSKNDFILEASPRTDVGKGASRRLRRLAGDIPAIIYGAGKEPTAITIPHKDIMKAVENEAFFSHIITVKVDGKDESVVIKALQRHPAKPRILHADFLRVSADQAIAVKVPLHFVNEDQCVGVKLEGGIINHMINELEISCLPGNLPEYIEVFMAELKVGESIHISDLALPEGVTSIDLAHGEDNNHPVAACVLPRAALEEEEIGAEAVEGEEAAEGDDSADSADDGDKAGE